MTEVILHAEDCILGMPRHINAESVDVCVTSPPYNLGIKYRKYNDKQKHAAYMDFTKRWLHGVFQVLKPGGSLFLNLGASPRSPLLPHQILVEATSQFVLQNTIHWIKSISLDMKDGSILSVGHFKPINSKRYLNDCHEFVFHLTKSGEVPIDRMALGVPYADKSNVKRWGHTSGKDKRCRGNCWFIPYQTIQNSNKQRPHPATFPPQLAEQAILLHGVAPAWALGPVNLTVLDPFIGIGNTALGCISLGVGKVIGFDIDESYLEDAKRLVANHVKT